MSTLCTELFVVLNEDGLDNRIELVRGNGETEGLCDPGLCGGDIVILDPNLRRIGDWISDSTPFCARGAV